MPPNGLLFSPLLALGVAGLSLLSLSPPPPKRPVMPPNMPPDFFSSGLVGLLAGFAGALVALPDGVLLAGRLAPNPPPELPEPPELLLPLDPPPKGELPVEGRLGVDELPELAEPPGELGLLPAGRLPPKGDEPPELLEPLLDPPNGDEPLLPAGRFAPPKPLPVLPELPPGEVGLLPAGRLPPNGDEPLDGVGLVGDVGRLPPMLEPLAAGRAGVELPLPGTGLVRAPAPGKPVVGRLKPLLELLNGFTREEEDEEPPSSSSSL